MPLGLHFLPVGANEGIKSDLNEMIAILRPDWIGQPILRRNLANIGGAKQAFLALKVFFLTLRLGLDQDLTDRSWALVTHRHLTPWYQFRRSLTSWGAVNKASPSINKLLGLRKAPLSTCYCFQTSLAMPTSKPLSLRTLTTILQINWFYLFLIGRYLISTSSHHWLVSLVFWCSGPSNIYLVFFLLKKLPNPWEEKDTEGGAFKSLPKRNYKANSLWGELGFCMPVCSIPSTKSTTQVSIQNLRPTCLSCQTEYKDLQ